MMNHNVPKVTLVGACPGSSDLITRRGFNTLRTADIILYDALISEELLHEIDVTIPRIYVGKRCRSHSFTQEDINKLITEKAYTHGHVVRLKGGNPFVFGRASEEIEYIASFGIPVSVVPSVSIAIGVPACQEFQLPEKTLAVVFGS
tara:strand:- start:15773 stop:16213 length:441 start_codon:yes stop_codon:yes gene_type:complete